jgi:hypothetical protein
LKGLYRKHAISLLQYFGVHKAGTRRVEGLKKDSEGDQSFCMIVVAAKPATLRLWTQNRVNQKKRIIKPAIQKDYQSIFRHGRSQSLQQEIDEVLLKRLDRGLELLL